MFAGETPTELKLGDVCPLPKDLARTRPVTTLDPIFKLVDMPIGLRLARVSEEHGITPTCAFGFVLGGAPEWAVEVAKGVERRARMYRHIACQSIFDNTGAYDTVSHRGLGATYHAHAAPSDVAEAVVNHSGGHRRVVNTAYGLGNESTAPTLGGGVAQGANSSPKLFQAVVGPALDYATACCPGYLLGSDAAAGRRSVCAASPVSLVDNLCGARSGSPCRSLITQRAVDSSSLRVSNKRMLNASGDALGSVRSFGSIWPST
jgi:hypothetical protein